MTVFEEPDFDGHEHVSFFGDPSAGLRAIIAIHRTGALGTAGGGCRVWPYPTEAAAVRDALRLSRAMTLKLALVGLPSGGAKAVVIADPRRDKTEALLRALGRAVHRLGGRYIAAEDVGTTPADLEVVGRETPWVARHPAGVDTADATGYGVFVGLRAAVRRRLGREDLRGVSVAVQGLGRVGQSLCRHLAEAGARLLVADVDEAAVRAAVAALGATPVPHEAILDVDADVFAPCALGDVIDDATLPRLRCAVVAGAANNPLESRRHADALAARGILYAPDIVINAGGVLGATYAHDAGLLRSRLEGIAATLEAVLDRAARDSISTERAAEALAAERLAERS